MKIRLTIFTFLLLLLTTFNPPVLKISHAQTSLNYSLNFSTYLGGNDYDILRDIATDSQGNIYIAGATASTTNPNGTPFTDTFGNRLNLNYCANPGNMRVDVLVAKFSPSGQLIWSHILGGPCYDRAYAIEVDSSGYIYIAGRAGPGFPTTTGSFQPTFRGYNTGAAYGDQNAFVAKLTNDGQIIFSSFAGVIEMSRDMAIDANGDIYLIQGYEPSLSVYTNPSSWYTPNFPWQPRGLDDVGILKISSDGSRVLWAAYFGGSGQDWPAASIRVYNNSPYLVFYTGSTDLPVTPGGRGYGGGPDDFYLARFAPDGNSLIFGTYVGGSGDELTNTHVLALDPQGNAYVLAWTSSPNFPVSTNAFQPSAGGGNSEIGIAEISPSGQFLAGTYLSGSNNDNGDGIVVDPNGNLVISGETSSTNFPVTSNAFQGNLRVGSTSHDGILAILSPDLSQLLYSTYMGGGADDASRSTTTDSNGNLYYAGWTQSSDFPLLNPIQSTFAGFWDIVLAKFNLTSVTPPTSTPIPTSAVTLPFSSPTTGPTIQPSSPTPSPIPTTSYSPGIMGGVVGGVDIGQIFGSPFGKTYGIADLVSIILFNSVAIAAVLLFLFMIAGGVMVIVGAGRGNKDDVAKGKAFVTAAILGFILIFSAYWIIRIAQIIFGFGSGILSPNP
jgi:hypothetical protein